MILVTGAAGKTGQAVMAALARHDVKVRALVRRPEQATVARAAGAAEIVSGDMCQADHVRRALRGIGAVYHIAPNMSPHERMMGEIMVEEARAAAVTHLVYHSVLHPQTETMPHHWHKLRVEEKLLSSGLRFTILQPAAYMQNILGTWSAIVDQGVYRVPYPVETALSMVDVRDVGEAAAIVLAAPGHRGATYELAGTEPLAQTTVAATIGHALGRSVRAEQIAPEQWRRQAEAAGLDGYAVDMLLKMFRYYGTHGFVGNPNVLTWLLGREPTSLASFVARVLREP